MPFSPLDIVHMASLHTMTHPMQTLPPHPTRLVTLLGMLIRLSPFPPCVLLAQGFCPISTSRAMLLLWLKKVMLLLRLILPLSLMCLSMKALQWKKSSQDLKLPNGVRRWTQSTTLYHRSQLSAWWIFPFIANLFPANGFFARSTARTLNSRLNWWPVVSLRPRALTTMRPFLQY